MLKKILLSGTFVLFTIWLIGACNPVPQDTSSPELLIRCDDIGMCHAVNTAAHRLAETGLPFSASVMFVCPWYQEAVVLLRKYPQISVGVHLTLNAEWTPYRWGPVVGSLAVPSLVDSCGYFWPSRKLFFEHNPQLNEIERELRAQIERALHSGLMIDYVDYHMGTAVSTPEMRALVERLAREYGLGISRYFGEIDIQNIYSEPPEEKTTALLNRLDSLTTDKRNLLVFHIGELQPEMNVLQDLNPFGLAEMSRHRQAELDALCSQRFHKALERRGVKLITYHDLIQSVGLEQMQNPESTGYK
jgi:predicted glycoside hydrolase/deacetylase ChbG (UPF0249 family)